MCVFGVFTLVLYCMKAHTHTNMNEIDNKIAHDIRNNMRSWYFYYSDCGKAIFPCGNIIQSQNIVARPNPKVNETTKKPITTSMAHSLGWPLASSKCDAFYSVECVVVFFCPFRISPISLPRSFVSFMFSREYSHLLRKQTNKNRYIWMYGHNQQWPKHTNFPLAVLFGKPKNVKYTFKFVAV